MKMGEESLICSVCGGKMNRVKVLPRELGSITRYKCTCGHCEDLPHHDSCSGANRSEVFALEGFVEMH